MAYGRASSITRLREFVAVAAAKRPFDGMYLESACEFDPAGVRYGRVRQHRDGRLSVFAYDQLWSVSGKYSGRREILPETFGSEEEIVQLLAPFLETK